MWRLLSWLWRPGLVKALVAHVRLTWRLVREPAVSTAIKALPVLAAVYVVSPLDFIPDIVPVVGEIDDLALLLLALQLFFKLCPDSVVDFHRRAIAENRAYSPISPAGIVIDAEWRVNSDSGDR